jgi:hypothetical protein
MVVEGTAAVAGGRCTMRNPAYEFLAGP